MGEPEKAMKMFEWTNEYALDFPEIDREHAQWFETIGRLHAAMLDGEGRNVVGALLEEMIRYTELHFAHEAELMSRVGYPGRTAHLAEHAELRNAVETFRRRFEDGETTMTIEMFGFLWSWLQQHTTTVDRRIADFCRTP
jgi:hemerythrin